MFRPWWNKGRLPQSVLFPHKIANTPHNSTLQSQFVRNASSPATTESKLATSSLKATALVQSALRLTDLELAEDRFQLQKSLANRVTQIKSYAKGNLHPGSTHYRKPVHVHLHKGRPVKALTVMKKNTGGRNNTGKITIRGRGGGHRRRARIIDYHRVKPGVHRVIRIEYDPNRLGHIALILSPDKELLYILAPQGLRPGDQVESFRSGLPKDFVDLMKQTNNGNVDDALLAVRIMKRGNCIPIHMIPTGSIIHAIGLRPDGRAQLARAAGTFARLLSKHPQENKVIVKLSSGEQRYVDMNCHASLGVVSNKEHKLISWGKAGKSRQRGRRPVVRGVAMNAHDHPHGGGRGKSKSNKVSQSMWGIKKFAKTRKFKNVNKNKVVDRRDKNAR